MCAPDFAIRALAASCVPLVTLLVAAVPVCQERGKYVEGTEGVESTARHRWTAHEDRVRASWGPACMSPHWSMCSCVPSPSWTTAPTCRHMCAKCHGCCILLTPMKCRLLLKEEGGGSEAPKKFVHLKSASNLRPL